MFQYFRLDIVYRIGIDFLDIRSDPTGVGLFVGYQDLRTVSDRNRTDSEHSSYEDFSTEKTWRPFRNSLPTDSSEIRYRMRFNRIQYGVR